MSKVLSWISDHLLLMVFIVVIFSLRLPQVGTYLSVLSIPLLALMVLFVCMTIKLEDLKELKSLSRTKPVHEDMLKIMERKTKDQGGKDER